MKIISHRGYWKDASEQNTEVAFLRSFDLGFGTETDIRDCAGELLISHNMPSGQEMTLTHFLGLLGDRELPLALNVKADGMQTKLVEILNIYPQLNVFVFDMSVPDLVQFLKTDVPAFTRMSEYERDPSCYKEAAGIWLDGFHSIWYDFDVVKRLVDDNKSVCLVSPELHGRGTEELWGMLKANDVMDYSQIVLCTDVPERARDFFGVA